MTIHAFNNTTPGDTRFRGSASNGYGYPVGTEAFRDHLSKRLNTADERRSSDAADAGHPDNVVGTDSNARHDMNRIVETGMRQPGSGADEAQDESNGDGVLRASELKDKSPSAMAFSGDTGSDRRGTGLDGVIAVNGSGKGATATTANRGLVANTRGGWQSLRTHSLPGLRAGHGGGTFVSLDSPSGMPDGGKGLSSTTRAGAAMPGAGQTGTGQTIARNGIALNGNPNRDARAFQGTTARLGLANGAEKPAILRPLAGGETAGNVFSGTSAGIGNRTLQFASLNSPEGEKPLAAAGTTIHKTAHETAGAGRDGSVRDAITRAGSGGLRRTGEAVSGAANTAGSGVARRANTGTAGAAMPGATSVTAAGSTGRQNAGQGNSVTAAGLRLQAEFTALGAQQAQTGAEAGVITAAGTAGWVPGERTLRDAGHSDVGRLVQNIRNGQAARHGGAIRSDMIAAQLTGGERTTAHTATPMTGYSVDPDWAEIGVDVRNSEAGPEAAAIKQSPMDTRPNADLAGAGRTNAMQGFQPEARREALPMLVKTVEEQMRASGSRENRISNYKLMFEDGRSLGMTIRKSAEGIRIVLNSRDPELNRFMVEHAEEITRLLKEKFDIALDIRFGGQDQAAEGGPAGMDDRARADHPAMETGSQHRAAGQAEASENEQINETVVQTGYNLFHWTA